MSTVLANKICLNQIYGEEKRIYRRGVTIRRYVLYANTMRAVIYIYKDIIKLWIVTQHFFGYLY